MVDSSLEGHKRATLGHILDEADYTDTWYLFCHEQTELRQKDLTTTVFLCDETKVVIRGVEKNAGFYLQ